MLKQIITFTFLFTVFFIKAQNYKFGKVSKEELTEKVYAKDSSAFAAVLYRNISISYDYVQSAGFQVITNVHERVKIYNKDGFDYGTIAERLYQSNNGDESLSGLKAYTYNLENGAIVKTKLKNSDTFSNELSKYYKEEKFTMPNLKEGSVIEYTYKLVSPFSYSIDEIVMQYDIPIKKQEIKIGIPEYYSFKKNIKGYLTLNPVQNSRSKKINFTNRARTGNSLTSSSGTSYSTSSVDYSVIIDEYNMVNVPALKEEPYVNSMNNYRSTINYEIQYVRFPNEIGKSYATTWESVVKTIYDSDNFGRQLDYKGYFKDDLALVLKGKTNEAERALAIFSFVQQRMSWNDYIGKYTDEGVKSAYKKKSGSVADINLILVAMLKEADLNANPVLISTRNNGVPMFPTRDGFNYVAASVKLNGEVILLDACNKFTEPNILPTMAVNWFGRLIEEDGSASMVQVVPNKVSKKTITLNINLKANGDIEGKERETYSSYYAYLFRDKNHGVSEDDYLEKKENNTNGMEISNYEIKNKDILGKNIVESFDFFMENQSDVLGDKIYFSPLFFKVEKENPFKLEKRDYPIDFVFPWQERFMINIKIPEGYEITSVPENLRLALPNQAGGFIYNVIKTDSGIQLMVDVKINQAIIPPHEYYSIKELYKNIIEKETEKVVLSKV
ncbi:DUF3857 domain-containing protein [Maribacter sp. R77961]|uniref:DUF3857 domain-containing protein n=1 Tax=Maribacter sp. R77961 TaxID=3093871 RepID=UPI0037CB36B6